MYKSVGGRRNDSSSHLTLATKKINTPKDSENILVTNFNIWVENIFNICHFKKSGVIVNLALAIAMAKVFLFFRKMRSYFDFEAMMVTLSLVTSTPHSNVSPEDTSNNCTISLGNPTLNEFDLGFATPILLVYLNIIIPSFLSLVSNMYGGYIINNFLF